jgi:hypothetical protein
LTVSFPGLPKKPNASGLATENEEMEGLPALKLAPSAKRSSSAVLRRETSP